MDRQLQQSTRPPTRVLRWKIEISAVIAAMGVAAVVVPPIAGTGNSDASGLTRSKTAAFSRLSAIPSHNGFYRASLVEPSEPARPFGSRVWTVEVQTATGSPVEGATLALESWMPDETQVLATHPRVTGYLGAGRYRIDGLRFDRHGWWNVRLQVAAAGGTDSLAFNLVR